MKENIENELLALEVGKNFIPKIEVIKMRIDKLRKEINLKYDFIFPAIRIVDNLEIPDNGFRIRILGTIKATGNYKLFIIETLLKTIQKVVLTNREILRKIS